MGLLKQVRKSIGLTQTAAVLVASLFVGILLSSFYLYLNLKEQRHTSLQLTQEIITAAKSGATSSVWTLDIVLAEQVVQGIMTLPSIDAARLSDEHGNVLASDYKNSEKTSSFTSWLSDVFLGKRIEGKENLTVYSDGEDKVVGELFVSLSPSHIAQEFVRAATSIFITGLLQSLSIACVLLWLSHRLVTAPITSAATQISKIDPEDPKTVVLPTPAIHRFNELGLLFRHTNRMIKRLSNAQKQLRNLATTDSLTNLPNRSLIIERLTHAINFAARNESLAAVLFLDLNRFKTINDSLGHDIGDVLLIETSTRLNSILRSNDSLGRLGGDEFLVVLEGLETIDDIVPTLQRITDTLTQPFFIRSHEILTSASIGIGVYPNDGLDIHDLMRSADLAMYEAKKSDIPWRFFAKDMSEKVEARLRIEAALNHALERDEFELYFQPKINADSAVVGCEALLRWHSNVSLDAQEFIGVAEDSGSIVPIGLWVLEEACRQLNIWAVKFKPIPIAVNISARQLKEPNFVARSLAIIKKYNINTRLIEFEITETIIIESIEKSITMFTELREAGITISIDDFGTGYSSLSYITQLPIDTLKIDRAFVSGPQRSKPVLETIVSMAQTLKLTTVAEGVETQEQRDWLSGKGCDFLQGYLISRPIPANKFEQRFLKIKNDSLDL